MGIDAKVSKPVFPFLFTSPVQEENIKCISEQTLKSKVFIAFLFREPTYDLQRLLRYQGTWRCNGLASANAATANDPMGWLRPKLLERDLSKLHRCRQADRLHYQWASHIGVAGTSSRSVILRAEQSPKVKEPACELIWPERVP